MELSSSSSLMLAFSSLQCDESSPSSLPGDKSANISMLTCVY